MTHVECRHVAITYANDHLQDGAGSQLLRIYGVYALSRFLGVSYVHSPIARIRYQGLMALENNTESTQLAAEYNRIFQIPSDLDLPERWTSYTLDEIDTGFIDRMKKPVSKDLSLIRIPLPHPVLDKQPEIYRFAKAVSPFRYQRSKVFKIAIHVRRGELNLLESHRMLPNSYYVTCALAIQEILSKLDIPFECELYTESASKPFEVRPDHLGIDGRIPGKIVLDPAIDHLEDFDAIPNLKRFINGDPIETLRRMATADALILSRSAFSVLAAVLSLNCTVICFPDWPHGMSDWLTWSKDGKFPFVEFLRRALSWKRGAN